MKSSGKCFLRAQRSYVPEIVKVVPRVLQLSLVMSLVLRVTQVVLVLKAWRGHRGKLRLSTVRCQTWPLVKVQPQLQLSQDWRGHAKELRLGTMKRAHERLLLKPSYSGRQQHFRDASTMRRPPRIAAAVEYRQLEPRRQCVCYKGHGWRSDPSTWRSLEDRELDPRHWMVGDWFLLLIVTVPWYFSLLKEVF